MDCKYPKMSPEKYAEMIIEAKKRRDESQGCAVPEPVGKWLESNGIDVDTLLRLKPLLRKYDSLTDEQKARIQELKDFEPNPGKATLTQVGETQTYLGGDNHGLPIYKEDIDMIKKSGPLAKRLVEMNKTGEVNTYDKNTETLRTLRDTIDEVYPEDLNTGPDTTENIQEIRDSGDVMFGDKPPVDGIPEMVEKSLLKSQGIQEALKSQGMVKNDSNERGHDASDVMWYFDPESQNVTDKEKAEIKRTRGIEIINDLMYPNKEAVDREIERRNKNVSPGDKPADYYHYGRILERMDDTHRRKNSDYGDAAYQGYKKFGDPYFLVQLHNKLSRLESLTVGKKTQQVKDESIDDTLLDMANYAVMYLESRHRND